MRENRFNKKTIVKNKSHIASVRSGFLRASRWLFEKVKTLSSDNGFVSEFSYEETLTVISKGNNAIWLTVDEVRRLKVLLDRLEEKEAEQFIFANKSPVEVNI